eukprot:TRINITY_DN6994_c0_g1_i3.p1 TRINITY_DN6994_c0_g1~~TRINITY_DN6994_c0_g1_i3.p1  ORF type:complete len:260 (+),score=43.55 TRINITY_DN6994_c0_g1_i3:47-781(+)
MCIRDRYLESLGCCEFENEYTVYRTKTGKEGEMQRDKDNVLFKCIENSSCCQRYCCSSFARAFKMDVSFKNITFDPATRSYISSWTPFLVLERDYACTCCCCNRPFIKIKLTEGGKEEEIGRVTDCWSMCGYVYDLRSSDEKEFYTVDGSCCQCGLCCRCPCGPCKQVDFGVLDPSGNNVGNISKVWPGCGRALFSDADSYSLTFPLNMTARFKIMVMVAAILIDYRHFEDSPADNDENRVFQS